MNLELYYFPLSPVDVRSIAIGVFICLYVCLYVCPLAYRKNVVFRLHDIFCRLHVICGRGTVLL